MQEMLIIMVLALIVFGPRKLPKIGKTLGRSLAEFRRTSTDLRNTLEREVQLEEFREARKTAAGVGRDVKSAFTGGLDPDGGRPGGFTPPTPVKPPERDATSSAASGPSATAPDEGAGAATEEGEPAGGAPPETPGEEADASADAGEDTRS